MKHTSRLFLTKWNILRDLVSCQTRIYAEASINVDHQRLAFQVSGVESVFGLFSLLECPAWIFSSIFQRVYLERRGLWFYVGGFSAFRDFRPHLNVR